VEEIRKGNNLPRASLTELRAAEAIRELIPCADMVKFAKNGSTVTTAAVKLARAYTGRKYIALCAEHPFFSYDDWFIGSTDMNKGVPVEHKPLTLKFHYNNIESVKNLFDRYNDQIAAVILEPATTVSPCPDECRDHFVRKSCLSCPMKHNNFLHQLRELCTQHGTVFILDEMITGFRWDDKGAQAYFDVMPDLATFGKGMANGFSVAALTGKKEIMEIGGIRNEGMERVFLISTTHGPEMGGLGAFVKTIQVYKELEVVKHLWGYGVKLIRGANSIAEELGIREYFQFGGYPCSPYYVTFDKDKKPSLEMRTLFAQEMLFSRVLIPWVALSCAHRDEELSMTLEAIRRSLKTYSLALEQGCKRYLRGNVIKPVFRPFN
jgi:glutamate-1-semialdehyde 2,1-aminomutase